MAPSLDPYDDCHGAASCDGAGTCLYGKTLFAGGYGTTGAQMVEALTVTEAGAILIGGSFLQQLPLPGVTLNSTGAFDGWFARWTQAGVLASASRYGDFSVQTSQFVNGLAYSQAGETYIGGVFASALYIANDELMANGFANFVARVEPISQTLAQSFAHSGGVFGCAMGLGPQVETGFLLAGACSPGNFSFQDYSQNIGQNHIAVASLSSATQLAWAKFFPISGTAALTSWPVTGPDGGIYLTGRVSGTINFGGGTVSAPAQSGFVVRMTPIGSFSWGFVLFSSADGVIHDVHLRPDGSLVAVGSYAGTLSTPSGGIEAVGGTDAFVAEVAADGTLLSIRTFGGPADDSFTQVDIDSAGLMMVAGHTQGDIDLGGGALPGNGLRDIMVAKFDPDGNHVWSRIFGSAGSDKLAGAAIGLGDTVVLAGDYYGPIDFGLGPISHAGDADVFLAILSP